MPLSVWYQWWIGQLNSRNLEAAANCYMRTEHCLQGFLWNFSRPHVLVWLFSFPAAKEVDGKPQPNSKWPIKNVVAAQIATYLGFISQEDITALPPFLAIIIRASRMVLLLFCVTSISWQRWTVSFFQSSPTRSGKSLAFSLCFQNLCLFWIW